MDDWPDLQKLNMDEWMRKKSCRDEKWPMLQCLCAPHACENKGFSPQYDIRYNNEQFALQWRPHMKGWQLHPCKVLIDTSGLLESKHNCARAYSSWYDGVKPCVHSMQPTPDISGVKVPPSHCSISAVT